ncbi:arylesterase [Novosphingobium sp. Gsoil 351]|uniref:arylesterase n=1 Tax=Novosphingobium sp. Gsoil 351 TaxID=2675225 RepID=UPI001E40BE92|nr:arylesterase [Novosphingobium sp. Gsoil 351]
MSQLAAIFAAFALSCCNKPATGGPWPTTATATAQAPRPPAGPKRLIVAFGDSLYAGYGLKPGESWPAKLEKALWAKGINAKVVNAGVSGDTTAAARARLAFVLDAQPRAPDLVAVGLGGNDMLRGLAPAEARANIDAILTELDRRKIPALLTGMLAAPNLGADYAKDFNPIFPALANKHKAALVPFLLQPVVGRPELIQPDHVHPTAKGIDLIVADTVDDVAKALPAKPG